MVSEHSTPKKTVTIDENTTCILDKGWLVMVKLIKTHYLNIKSKLRVVWASTLSHAPENFDS